MERIVDVATDHVHLSAERGFLLVSQQHEEMGRVALDDILAVIVHGHGISWSTNLVVRLAERGASMAICAANHLPVALISPLMGHHAQGARMRAQWEASKPLMKQLWRQIIVAKITMQGSFLAAQGRKEAQAFDLLARSVRSGDPDNAEAQAARRYWPLLMGTEFRRDQNADGANALLNYGYTVMRATLARAVVGSGLHPTIGLFHANRTNSFALADDLIEPFRPLVDAVVAGLLRSGVSQITPAAKHRLVRLIGCDLRANGEISPVSVMAERLALSVARSFETGKASLQLFDPPSALEWAALMDGGSGDE